VLQSQFGYHCTPEGRFTDREWRGAEVKNDRRALAYQSFNRVAVIQVVAQIFVRPDIFADGDADFLPKELDWLLIVRRLEVSGLVEHIVSRQESLEYLSNRSVSFQHRAAVDKRLSGFFGVKIYVSDEQRNCANLLVQRSKLLESLGNKSGFEDKVLRGVAGEGKLRRNYELSAPLTRFAVSREDFLSVGLDIPNGRIDLGKADSHRFRIWNLESN
jgi:hypothetical protein